MTRIMSWIMPQKMTQSMPRALLIAAVTAASLAASAHADFLITLRGNATPVTATSVSSSLRGVLARPSDTLIPWDMVRSVELTSGGASSDAALAEFLATGKDLWRARTRLERDDNALAQPLFAKHWERFRQSDGPTAALVAEGMLRCALATGDFRGAVEPWLACLRLGSTGEPTRFPLLPPVLDDATGLLPALSPFVPAAKRADLAAACAAVNSGNAGANSSATAGANPVLQGSVPQEVAMRIARMIRATDGSTIETSAIPAKDAPPAVRALGLLEQILAASDARACDRAIAEFDRAFAEPPAYLGAWKLAAIGTHAARAARSKTLATSATAEERAEHSRALESAALAMLAVAASGLDHSGLVELYAFDEAVALLRESGDDASAAQVAALADERRRELDSTHAFTDQRTDQSTDSSTHTSTRTPTRDSTANSPSNSTR